MIDCFYKGKPYRNASHLSSISAVAQAAVDRFLVFAVNSFKSLRTPDYAEWVVSPLRAFALKKKVGARLMNFKPSQHFSCQCKISRIIKYLRLRHIMTEYMCKANRHPVIALLAGIPYRLRVRIDLFRRSVSVLDNAIHPHKGRDAVVRSVRAVGLCNFFSVNSRNLVLVCCEFVALRVSCSGRFLQSSTPRLARPGLH